MELLDREMQESAHAHGQLYWYTSYQVQTNFPHFYYQALVEADPKTIAVRKAFFQADQLRKSDDNEQAIQKYMEAFSGWAQVLKDAPEFQRDMSQQEDTYEILLKYNDLVYLQRGKLIKELMLVQDYITHVASTPFNCGVWSPRSYFARGVQMELNTPLDGLIGEDAIMSTRNRFKLPVPRPEMPDTSSMGPGTTRSPAMAPRATKK